MQTHQTSAKTAKQATREEREESCRSCLYTGVATCMSLSVYFAHLAFEDNDRKSQKLRSDGLNKYRDTEQPKTHSHHSTRGPIQHKHKSIGIQGSWMKSLQGGSPTMKSNRPFLLLCSACWVAAGAYRWYLN